MTKAIAEAALADCQSRGSDTSVAVVNRADQPLLMLRVNTYLFPTPTM